MGYMDNHELSLGEQVHLANKDLRNILRPSIIAAIVGLGIIAIVVTFTYFASTTISEYTYTVYRINSAIGPLCDPLNFIPVADSDPAKVTVLDGQNADKAGIMTGDMVTKINGLQISNAKEFNDLQDIFPNLKAGDAVSIEVLRGGQHTSFTVQAVQPLNNPKVVSLGMIIPAKCLSYYELKEEKKGYGPELITIVSDNLDNIRNVGGIFATIFAFFLVLTLWKGRRLSNEINDWERAYLDQYFVLTFETNTPIGSTNGEKVFNMAQTVFPELRQKDGKSARWQGTVTGKDNYNFDCFQTTGESSTRLFVAKQFEKGVTIDMKKLQEMCDIVTESKKISTLKDKIRNLERIKIFRIVCVANEYDQSLLDDFKREELMGILSKYPLDLIIDRDGTYSVLWVSNN
jgi:hypothetical protein